MALFLTNQCVIWRWNTSFEPAVFFVKYRSKENTKGKKGSVMKKIVENLKDCSIQWKLNFMVGLSAVMMGILGASGLIGTWELNQQIKKLYQVLLEYENTIGEEVYAHAELIFALISIFAVVLLIVATTISVVVAKNIIQGIVEPVEELMHAAKDSHRSVQILEKTIIGVRELRLIQVLIALDLKKEVNLTQRNY